MVRTSDIFFLRSIVARNAPFCGREVGVPVVLREKDGDTRQDPHQDGIKLQGSDRISVKKRGKFSNESC